MLEAPSQAIDALLRERMPPDAPGGSVLVAHDGEVLFQRSYGLAEVEAGTPNTPRTNFRLASVTKQFTAMAILMLVERGKLKLESRLTDFFPTFPAYGRDITIRQMLDHTSGLPDYAELVPDEQEAQLSDEDALHILERQTEAQFAPGSRFQYSNSAYVVLGLIVARVSGVRFAPFLAENIFQPLDMRGTVAYEAGISTVRDRAFGYTPDTGGFRRTDQSVTSATLGDGGIYSSAEDLFRWDQALYTTKLIGEELRQLAFTPQTFSADEAVRYGFGWRIDDRDGLRRIRHSGETIGFRSEICRIPDRRFTVIVLMNRNDGRPTEIANQIVNLCRNWDGFSGSNHCGGGF